MKRSRSLGYVAILSAAWVFAAPVRAEDCLAGDCIIGDPAWVTDSFKITCWGNDRLFIKTYLVAIIANERGYADCQGGYLKITNTSRKFGALYNHLGTPPNMELEPNQELLLPLPIYRGSDDQRATVIKLAIRYHP